MVTGGAGYVGSVLVPKLLEDGHSVTVLDLYIYGRELFADLRRNPKFREVQGDLRDPAAVADDGPADDPLEPRRMSHGLFVRPRYH